MMIAIDTHAVVKRLMAAGFTDAQAEAVTLVVREAQDIDMSNLATKDDLRVGLAAAKTNLAETKVELLKWIAGGAIVLQTVVIIGALVALMRTMGH
jgi:hypothetical protein